MDQLKIIEVRSEIAAGKRGASLGVDAIKLASLDTGSDYFSRMNSEAVDDENRMLFELPMHKHAKYIEGVYVMLKRVRDAVSRVMREEGKFPVVLAGDHATAAGTILGIKKARPDQKLGVIWIDAHADIHSPYTTPSGNMHGMPLAMVLGLDNKENQVNNPDSATQFYWNKIKKLGKGDSILEPENIVFFVVRDTEPAEADLLRRYNIRNFSVDEVNENGIQAVSAEALSLLDHCDIIYISFDVDSIDAKFAKGTGTPVPNGLTVEKAKALNEELIKSKKVCAWEMVEVNPVLDTENNMAKMAFEILDSTTGSLIKHF